jgi:hypothetical protein
VIERRNSLITLARNLMEGILLYNRKLWRWI